MLVRECEWFPSFRKTVFIFRNKIYCHIVENDDNNYNNNTGMKNMKSTHIVIPRNDEDMTKTNTKSHFQTLFCLPQGSSTMSNLMMSTEEAKKKRRKKNSPMIMMMMLLMA